MAKSRTTEPAQVKLTDDIRAKLHGFALVSSNVVIPYKLEIDGVPDEFLPIFTVKTLTVTEMDDLKANQFIEEKAEFFTELVRTHLLGWKNLYDISTNTIVEYVSDTDKGCRKDLFELLPNRLKIDILTFITSMSAN